MSSTGNTPATHCRGNGLPELLLLLVFLAFQFTGKSIIFISAFLLGCPVVL
jgi:hypothetical protein